MKLIQVILANLLFLSSFFAFSANIVPIEFNGVSASYEAKSDFIALAPANKHGISYNKFTSFISDRAILNILNTDASNPASIIVFEAPNFVISTNFKLIGHQAEILFISQKNKGVLNCSSCSFDDFVRVTLAAASFEKSYSHDSKALGNLNSTTVGRVDIKDLDAPNVLALDVLAREVSLNGLLNANQKVKKEISGGYSASKNGSLVLGAGSINLNIGALLWNYEKREIVSSLVKTSPTPEFMTLAGEIQSAEVKILSTAPITLNTKITNKVDILSSASYRGKILVPSNSTVITTLPNAVFQLSSWLPPRLLESNIVVMQNISSNGDISITSSGSIDLKKDLISEKEIHVLAKTTLKSSAKLLAENVSFSAGRVINRGSIEGKQKVTLSGDSYISNEFGGNIIAKEVVARSGGVFRNGSRTAYITDHSSIYGRIMNHKPILNPSAIENGFYYITDHKITNKTKATHHYAHIYADVISIGAAAFENINPYWAAINYDDEFDLSGVATLRRDLLDSVSITAKKKMTIEVDEYAYNSSAILNMESEEGLLSIKGGILKNDRYRQANLLIKNQMEYTTILSTYIGSGGTFGHLHNIKASKSFQNEKLLTRSYVYSAPGRIYSAGEFYAGPKVASGSSVIINDLGFIEIGKNATVASTSIKQMSLSHYKITKITGPDIGYCTVGNNARGCYKRKNGVIAGRYEIGGTSSEETVIKSRDLDAFFSVGGKLYAQEAALHVDNSSAFVEYLTNAINHRVKKAIGNTVPTYSYTDLCVAGRGVWCDDYHQVQTKHETTFNNKKITDALNSNNVTNINLNVIKETTTTKKMGMLTQPKKTIQKEAVLTKTWSIFDTLNEYYESIKQSILNKIQEIKDQLGWWS